jgi:Flp pilus assembly protein TadG
VLRVLFAALRLPHLIPALSAPPWVHWGAEREIRRLFRDRRAAIAPLVAVAAPVLVMSLGLGVETSRWFVAGQELQRTADVAALAGAMAYSQANDAQKGTTAAAKLAQVNGVSGSSTPTWDSANLKLTSNKIVAQIVSGVRSSSDQAMKVTVSQDVPLYLAGIFTTASSKTVTASATAELVKSPTGGPVCLLALNGDINGVVSGTDVTLSGNANLDATGCILRSDAGVSISGNVNVTASGIVASGAVTVSGGSASLNNTPITQNVGQIPDPFLANTSLQNALSQAKQVTAAAISCNSSGCSGPSNCCTSGADGSWTINPGSYSGITVSGKSTVNLAAGLYLVNGGVSLSGNGTVDASGVTIVATGDGVVNGNTSATLTAASSTTATGGAIPGVLFATSSTGQTKFNGNNTMPFTGAIYAPNGSTLFSGNATDNSSGCAEVVAASVTITGNAQLATNCSTYGLPTINSLPQTTTVSLVQ